MRTQVGLPCTYPTLCHLITWAIGLLAVVVVAYLIKLGWDEWKKVNHSSRDKPKPGK